MSWKNFPPQRANTGSILAPTEIIGRTEFVARLWHKLENSSILLTAQRRSGKTSVLTLMKAAPPENTLVFKRDLENVRTPIEFLERILEDITRSLSIQRRTAEWCHRLRQEIDGIAIGGLKLPKGREQAWKTHLERLIGDLMRHEPRRIVFLWDEMPLMLDNIRRQCNEQTAMDVLDTLRTLRQKHPRLRMVFTGSVGLHHVLSALRHAGHANLPTNDMSPVDLPILSREDAMGLAWSLLCGEKRNVVDPESVVACIADTMDCLPFYIQHLVNRLADTTQTVTLHDVETAAAALLIDPHDPCGMRNYQDRIQRHYQPQAFPFAYALLDQLAVAETALPFDALFNRLKHQLATEDEETTHSTLALLESDHYVLRNLDSHYSFRFPIVARAWRIQRGKGS